MLTAIAALLIGITFLGLSADKFVEGAVVTAREFGIPPLLVGMLVIGFGSSTPELIVTGIAASDGNVGLALGNAVGSNISNIGLILGITALMTPVIVRSSALTTELPILIFVTIVCTLFLASDGFLTRTDGWLLIGLFTCVMSWSVYIGLSEKSDELGAELEHSLEDHVSLKRAIFYLIGGLVVLVVSSRIMIWGGVELATLLGVSDLIVGLTIIAIGTSLPELASSIAAVKRNEHDLALGNVIGSNLFNTTIVIGVAGVILPTPIEVELIERDLPVMVAFTILFFIFCSKIRSKQPRINRYEGGALLLGYLSYNAYLISQMI